MSALPQFSRAWIAEISPIQDAPPAMAAAVDRYVTAKQAVRLWRNDRVLIDDLVEAQQALFDLARYSRAYFVTDRLVVQVRYDIWSGRPRWINLWPRSSELSRPLSHSPSLISTRKDMTMPKVNKMFPSKYLKADEFTEDGQVLTIRTVKEERIGQGKDADDKWVLYFDEVEKGLVLNKTNTGIIADLYGDDTDEWEGKLVTLYATEVQFQGEMVDAIRIKKRAPRPAAAAAGKKSEKPASKSPPAREPEDDEDEEDNPF